ncbi:MAG TPA: quinone oxidoreductase [Steroidobacteraceae bacterium]|nr:quinone oxidoreductase [Steroidobacteraceae bacterium]
MTRGILVRATGGPDALEWTDITLPRLKRNEARVRHTAIGVNFIDVYDRTGLYAGPLPMGIGREAAGVVEDVGRGVKSVAVGERVAYVLSTPGSYAEARHVPADRLVKLPPTVTDQQAAAMMLKGLTAQYLLRRTYKVKKRDPVVIHAAAGGVGLIAVQWARHLGAHVIAVVGSEPKAEVVRAHGAHDVIITSRDDLVARVRQITAGKGVPVVYDSIGKDTFQASLDCLRPLGLMVTFGNASGPVPPVAPLELSRRGSLYLTRPTLFHYIASKGDLNRAARELFEVVGSGVVQIRIGQTYALADAARAHTDLEARRTTGSTVLIP